MARFFYLIVLMFYFLLLVGCDNATEADNIVDEQITIAGSNWYGHAPIWIGIERGIFARYGFKVKWLYLTSSMERIKAASTDAIQFASVGQISMLNAMADNITGFYWIGSQDNSPGMEGLIAHGDIKSIIELKGKRIGLPLGTSVEITLRQLLEEHNLKVGMDKDVELINLKVVDILATFRAGYTDAVLIWEPYFSSLKGITGTNVLATDKDTDFYKRFNSIAGPDVLVMSKAWVYGTDDKLQRAKRFMKAYFESVEWIKNTKNLQQTAELIQGTYIRQPLSKIKKNLKSIRWNSAHEQRTIMSGSKMYKQTDYLINLLQKYNDAKQVDFKKYVYLDVLPE